MQEAAFYDRGKHNNVVCRLCCQRCLIREGKRGKCGVRENQEGTLYSLVYGRLIANNSDPVEKKPLFHFQPGSRSWSVSTVGCNFHCLHCQNAEISQYPHLYGGRIPGEEVTAEEVIRDALRAECSSISYTYVEPTIFYEFARDCATLAREQGLKNIFVSNGYMTPEVNRQLARILDGINIDLKSFREETYKDICGGSLQPVLDNIRLLSGLGVWVEVTTLVIPGLNDSPGELREIAAFLKSIDPAIPWHVTAFYPSYKMTDRPPTSTETLARARETGLKEGLRFVYTGNIPGSGGESTWCPSCGGQLILRRGYSIRENRIQEGQCPDCRETIEGEWQ
ncbi:MAG: AmmeMemoRadiSam system radical SAM enzyme [Desulfurivibrionaceae bacterium]